MSKIKQVFAREILDARGYPALEVEIILDSGVSASASVATASIAGDLSRAAISLQDGDLRFYQGQGIKRLISKIKEIVIPSLIGLSVKTPGKIDQLLLDLDGTSNKKNLGANVLLALSLAVFKVAANHQKQTLFYYLQQTFSLAGPKIPVPLINIFNGGRHADTNLDFQEFLLIPKKDSVSEMLKTGAEIFHELGVVLQASGYDTDTGSEGGYAPDLDSSIEALDLILAAALRCTYRAGRDFSLGINIGSAILYEKQTGKYIFPLDHARFSSADLIGLYHEWLKKYPLTYLEDAVSDEEWGAWRELGADLGSKLTIAGGSLFRGEKSRLRQGIAEKAANAVTVKLTEIGTITEVIEYIKLAQRHNYQIIISHNDDETNDDFIADLAVAVGADYLKAGSITRGERLAKYNRLLKIETLLS